MAPKLPFGGLMSCIFSTCEERIMHEDNYILMHCKCQQRGKQKQKQKCLKQEGYDPNTKKKCCKLDGNNKHQSSSAVNMRKL